MKKKQKGRTRKNEVPREPVINFAKKLADRSKTDDGSTLRRIARFHALRMHLSFWPIWMESRNLAFVEQLQESGGDSIATELDRGVQTMAIHEQIDHPSAWKGRGFNSKDDYSFDLGQRHRTVFHSLVERVRKSRLNENELGAEHLAMPEIESDLHTIRREITHGRGLVVVRGFPVDEMCERDLQTVFWAMGASFGHAVSQSPRGDRIGVVSNNPKPERVERAYRTAQRLNLHTDSDEIVGLLCLRKAMSGGYTRLASAVAIHNEIAARFAELLEPLYEGFHYHWLGTQSPDSPSITEYKVPVFCHVDGLISTCYVRELIHQAAFDSGQPLPSTQLKALAAFDAIADQRDIVLKFMLEPGEASFINNFTVLHSRTGFSDFPQENKKRRLLRLWLRTTPRRPVHTNMRRYCDDRPGAGMTAPGDS